MIKLIKKFHLYGLYKKICFYIINHIFSGLNPISNKVRISILRSLGYKIGNNTTIVSPFIINGNAMIDIGDCCWINYGFCVHGNGKLRIEDNCDVGPEVTVLTGGHEIGGASRRAGTGQTYSIVIGSGTWICAKTTILKEVKVGTGCVLAAGSLVNKNVSDNSMVGGIPAKKIKELS